MSIQNLGKVYTRKFIEDMSMKALHKALHKALSHMCFNGPIYFILVQLDICFCCKCASSIYANLPNFVVPKLFLATSQV